MVYKYFNLHTRPKVQILQMKLESTKMLWKKIGVHSRTNPSPAQPPFHCNQLMPYRGAAHCESCIMGAWAWSKFLYPLKWVGFYMLESLIRFGLCSKLLLMKLAVYCYQVAWAVSCLTTVIYPANPVQRITRHLCPICLFAQIELLPLFITIFISMRCALILRELNTVYFLFCPGLCSALSVRALHGGNEGGEDPIDRKAFCPYFTKLLSQRKRQQRRTISEHMLGPGVSNGKRVRSREQQLSSYTHLKYKE